MFWQNKEERQKKYKYKQISISNMWNFYLRLCICFVTQYSIFVLFIYLYIIIYRINILRALRILPLPFLYIHLLSSFVALSLIYTYIYFFVLRLEHLLLEFFFNIFYFSPPHGGCCCLCWVVCETRKKNEKCHCNVSTTTLNTLFYCHRVHLYICIMMVSESHCNIPHKDILPCIQIILESLWREHKIDTESVIRGTLAQNFQTHPTTHIHMKIFWVFDFLFVPHAAAMLIPNPYSKRDIHISIFNFFSQINVHLNNNNDIK